jgi:hypothetical protein
VVDLLWVTSLVVGLVVVVTDIFHPMDQMELMFVDFCGTCASDEAMETCWIM